MLLQNSPNLQPVKVDWGKAQTALPLHVFLHFRSHQLEKITLEMGKAFALFFVESPEQMVVIEWFAQYLKGTHSPFPLPLSVPKGDFTKKVLTRLGSIPMGEVQTYGEVAKALGNPKGARAVGQACHNNPFPLVIPCHRVVRVGKKVGGFAFGASMKALLLDFEKSHLRVS